MAETQWRTEDELHELVPVERVRVGTGPRRLVLVGAVVVLALAGGAFVAIRDGGPSETEARVSRFNAAMFDQPTFTYELDLIAENVTSADMEDVVPGGPVEVLQIDGTVAAEDRFEMHMTHRRGVEDVVRVGPDVFRRAMAPDDDDGQWWRSDYAAPELPSTAEVRASLEPDGDLDASEARLRTISAIYLNEMILDPAQLPDELDNLDPQAREEGFEPDGEEGAVVDWVPFPVRYRSVVTRVQPMVANLQLGPDGHPQSARFEIRDDDKAIIAELRFADWGRDLVVVAPEGAEEAKQVFEEVGEAIGEEPPAGGAIDDQPLDTEGSLEPRDLDTAMVVWMPTAVPSDFQLADVVPADESGDDSCRGVFAVWMAKDRPAASWVTQDTPTEGNSQLLTVRSVPADCAFVERTPLFGPGPFGDRPARRIGDQWEVLVDDTWVVRFDSVVVTWDELVAMVASLDAVTVESLHAQLP